jgi:SSS family solute:Na+ symporter
MTATTPILMIIFAFVFLPLVLAEVARQKSVPTIENFFLQDRKMSAVMVFFTVYATWVSSFAFLGSTSSFYLNGPVYMTAFAWNALFGILFMVIGKRIWYYGKARGYVTPTDFFNDIYDSPFLSGLITFTMLVFTLPYLQIQLTGGAYLIEVATGGVIPWRISGLLFYLIIIIYLWAGGIRAVALTDILYGSLIFVSMLGIGIYIITKAGGIDFVFQSVIDMDRGNVVLSGPDEGERILTWLSLFVVVPVGALMGPPMWLRAYAVGKKKTFRLMPFLITFATIMYLGSILSGSAGILLDPGIVQSDTILPTLLVKYGNSIVATFFLCGIASASLSTANSQIHAVAAIYTIDIHRRYINKTASEKKLVNVGKWAVLFISALAYLLMFSSPAALIVETGTIALSGTAQIIVPTVGALFYRKANKNAASAGLIGGLTTLTLLRIFAGWSSSYCGIVALAVNCVLFFFGSRIMESNAISREKIFKYREAYKRDCS